MNALATRYTRSRASQRLRRRKHPRQSIRKLGVERLENRTLLAVVAIDPGDVPADATLVDFNSTPYSGPWTEYTEAATGLNIQTYDNAWISDLPTTPQVDGRGVNAFGSAFRVTYPYGVNVGSFGLIAAGAFNQSANAASSGSQFSRDEPVVTLDFYDLDGNPINPLDFTIDLSGVIPGAEPAFKADDGEKIGSIDVTILLADQFAFDNALYITIDVNLDLPYVEWEALGSTIPDRPDRFICRFHGTDQYDKVTVQRTPLGIKATFVGPYGEYVSEVTEGDIATKAAEFVLRPSDFVGWEFLLKKGNDEFRATDSIPHTLVVDGGEGVDLLIGTPNGDIIIGGPDRDFIDSGGGDDIVLGGPGDDVIHGGVGEDTLDGDEGKDRIHGGAGRDFIFGREDDDRLWGDDGGDFIWGNAGHDTLRGGQGKDDLKGGAGRDTLYGNAHGDKLDGGAGRDILYGNSGNDVLKGRAGNDVLRGNAGNDRLFGDAGRDTLYGNQGGDELDGGTGIDALYGNAGNDILRTEYDDDVIDLGPTGGLYGGSGRDIFVVSGTSSPAEEDDAESELKASLFSDFNLDDPDTLLFNFP